MKRCECGELHWHGECSDASVTHFAIDGPEFTAYENERPTARTRV